MSETVTFVRGVDVRDAGAAHSARAGDVRQRWHRQTAAHAKTTPSEVLRGWEGYRAWRFNKAGVAFRDRLESAAVEAMMMCVGDDESFY